jgi:hypothetical protein
MCAEPPCIRTSSHVYNASALTVRRTALSKNFLISPESDIDYWNAFSHIIVAYMLPLHALYSKRADTVGEPQSAEKCASHMPSLKAQEHGESKVATAALSPGNRFANSIRAIDGHFS